MKTIKLICFEFGVNVDDLFKSRLDAKTSLARQAIIYILYNYTNSTMADIRNKVGINENRAIYNALYRFRDRLALSDILKVKVEGIKQELDGNKSKKAA
jgi:chromosomal replication initiation ATPase DnaA